MKLTQLLSALSRLWIVCHFLDIIDMKPMACTEEELAKARRYRERHREVLAKKRLDAYWQDPEKARNAMRVFRSSNRQRLNLKNREGYRSTKRQGYITANWDKALAAKKKYRERNRPKLLAASRERYTIKRERELERLRRYRAEHHELRLETERKSRAKHAEKLRVRNREYKLRFPEKARAATRNRRARIRGVGGKHTAAEIADLFKRQGGKCATCRTKITKSGPLKYHVDHVISLGREGSSNSIDNLQLLCGPCNRKKSDLHPDEWAARNGLLFC